MGGDLRLAVGIMGNAASLLLYAAPILTFKEIIEKRSTEKYSCVPYIIALLNSLTYTWYGLPVVSVKWENFPLVTINGLGILLELSFVVIYIWFAPVWGKKLACLIVVPIITIFCIAAFISSFALHDHHHRKVLIGSVGFATSITMFASPLIAVGQVIRTKSVEFMPFYLSFFSFLASLVWMAYGLLAKDLFLSLPNIIGSPFGFIQLVLYVIYRKKKSIPQEEPIKVDLEKNVIQSRSQQAAADGTK